SHPMREHIRHFVVLMFENRGFDQLLGWLYDGDPDPDVRLVGAETPGTPRFQGLTPALCEAYAQPLSRHGRTATYPIVRGAPPACPRWDPQEGFAATRRQIGPQPGQMLGFLQDYWDFQKDKLWFDPEDILRTFDPARGEASVTNTLAKGFAVSDAWFASIPSQTSINRAFSLCGRSIGYASKADRLAGRTTAMVDNHYDLRIAPFTIAPASFSCPTIWNVLAAHGHDTEQDWKIYWSNVWPPHVPGHGPGSYTWKMFEALRGLVPAQGDPRYTRIDQLFADLDNGSLPRFAYVEPDYSFTVFEEVGLHIGNDFHPPGHIGGAERLLARIFRALRRSRYWEDTLLVVLFDEHGGTFDHVAPPRGLVAPTGGDVKELGFDFTEAGVRVPALFISPWVAPRTVLRSPTATPFDHTSLPATLLDWWGLPRAGLGERVAAAPSFADVVGD
ncbi:MAG: alkaline phosphatase family protein, partial [Myxococcota bacterium]